MLLSKPVARLFLRQNHNLSDRCKARYPIDLSKPNPYVPDYEAVEKQYKLFRFISFGICLPTTLLYAAYVWNNFEHKDSQPLVPYTHLFEQATKPNPFGPKSPWHKDGVNFTPDEYREAYENIPADVKED